MPMTHEQEQAKRRRANQKALRALAVTLRAQNRNRRPLPPRRSVANMDAHDEKMRIKREHRSASILTNRGRIRVPLEGEKRGGTGGFRYVQAVGGSREVL